MPADETREKKAPIEYGTCPVCGYVMVPVLPLSPCGHDEPSIVAPLNEPGIVYSWTAVGLNAEEPTVLAMADFLDGRIRITAPVIEGAEIAIGEEVTAAIGRYTPFALYRASGH